MKTNVFLLILYFLIIDFSFAEKREKDLLSLINLEIKTIEHVSKKGEQLNYRLFELYSEKTKIMRRAENELMLKDQAAGKKINKNSYYKNSQAVFNQALEFGQKFVKQFPKSRYQSSVYYGLASNQIEVQNNVEGDKKILIEWLNIAIQKAVSDEKKYLSQVKLAEVYYTIKEYELAIKMYKPVIQNSNDKWYTKNLYNLSWCYFQTKNYSKSIELAKIAFFKSKNKKYENVAEQSMDALDYFHVFNQSPELGVAFHIKNNPDQNSKMEHFIKLLNLSQKFISSEVALKTEKPARSYCLQQKDFACLLHMSSFKLDIYKEGKRYDEHADTVKNALREYQMLQQNKIAFDTQVLSSIINNVGETASTFQQLAYKSHYAFRNNKDETYKTIIEYYGALKVFNPTFHHEYAFLQGELSYKEERFELASQYYLESLSKINSKSTPIEFSQKLFKSMLALANDARFNNKAFFEKSHMAYIAYHDTQDITIPIYQALFKFYQAEKRYDQSETLLLAFVAKLPKQASLQQEMTKVVLNNYISLKNIEKVNYWINTLKKGFLSFDKKFIDQNVIILAQLLFENAQKKEMQKDYLGAIAEYTKINENKDYPTEIKADSLYNIAVNYIQLRDPDKSFSHLKESLRLKTRKDMLKKINDVQIIAKEYVVLQSLPSASSVYKFLLKNYCTELNNLDAIFLTYAQVEMAQDDVTLFKNSADFKQCVFSEDSLKIARNLYVEWLIKNEKYSDVADLATRPEYKLQLDTIFQEFYARYWRFENKAESSSFSQFNKHLERFYVNAKNFLKEESHLKYTSLKSWENVSQSLAQYEDEIKKSGVIKGDMQHLQPILESALEKLMKLKDEKLSKVEKINDPNLYQAEIYSLTKKFQMTNNWIGTWVCKSKKAEDHSQWNEVKIQVQKGLNDQIVSFKEAISSLISKGALPLVELQNVRGDFEFDKYLYEKHESSPFFIRHRSLSSVGGKQ